ncbi:hypothetical protein BCR44DRAFT_48340 [Catenaria anguillulae PL171]|uniref:Uncharacterized protein n=1 Tax=Catenaria anguillulae PL171 TaxID=765915 RepID=A0A1Y2HEC1_9FUNG|nr:hypothetical protein BCR44DRAFT_48340 [Catenaria anguillulae PL171]
MATAPAPRRPAARPPSSPYPSTTLYSTGGIGCVPTATSATSSTTSAPSTASSGVSLSLVPSSSDAAPSIQQLTSVAQTTGDQ